MKIPLEIDPKMQSCLVVDGKEYCCSNEDTTIARDGKNFICKSESGMTITKARLQFHIVGLLAFVGFLAMIVINVLANALPLNGKTTGAISDANPTLITPIGWTFAIWGVIYVLLGVYTVIQLQYKRDAYIIQISLAYLGSSIINFFWIIAWHYELLIVSLIAIIGLLVMLVVIVQLNLRNDRTNYYSVKSSWWITVPFSVYFGWVSVATVLNAAIVLKSISWDQFGLSEETWAIIMLIIVGLLTITMLAKGDIVYGLVVIWALVGILAKQQTLGNPYPAINSTIYTALVAIGAEICISLIRNVRFRFRKTNADSVFNL